jgi:hypothetical protein
MHFDVVVPANSSKLYLSAVTNFSVFLSIFLKMSF